MLNIIDLKGINDKLGHAFGDRVLVETAHRVQRVAGDCPVWRIAGDDFLIATRVGGAGDLRRFTRGLRTAIEQWRDGISVGVWMGGAIASPDCNVADELLCLADLAMYHAARRRTRELIIAPDDTWDLRFRPPRP